MLKLLVIIPAYNEEGNIVRVASFLRDHYPQYDFVIVNDGSSDATPILAKKHHFPLIDQPINLGLAGTFQTGIRYALEHGYEAAVQFDGDGQHRPEYIAEMAKKIEEGYDIVIGSRFVNKKKPHTARMAGSNLIQHQIRITTGKTIHDPTSGFRMYNRRTMHVLSHNLNMGPEPDTIAYLIRCGAKVTEVQVIMDERIAGQSYLNLFTSASYIATVCTSILLVGWFRKKLPLEESPL